MNFNRWRSNLFIQFVGLYSNVTQIPLPCLKKWNKKWNKIFLGETGKVTALEKWQTLEVELITGN